jgi:hypothetical protein
MPLSPSHPSINRLNAGHREELKILFLIRVLMTHKDVHFVKMHQVQHLRFVHFLLV